MSETPILKLEDLYKKAIKHAKYKGFRDEAEDFAGYITIKWLEGKSQHQTIGQSFIDYLRRNHGDNRTIGGRDRVSAQARQLRIAPDGEDDGQNSISEDRLGHVFGELPDNRIPHIETSRFLSSRFHFVFMLYTKEELTLKEIGQMMNISESRASQILTAAKLEVLRFEGLRQMRRLINEDRSRLLVDWISL